MRTRLSCALTLSALAAACGGATGTTLFSGGDGGPELDAGTDASRDAFVDGPPWPSGCPRSEPVDKAPCAKANIICSYGDSPIPQCRHQYVCDSAGWRRYDGNGACPSTSGCPAGPQNDLQCGSPGATCPYADGTLCTCNQAQAGNPCIGGPSTWKCTSPSTRAPGCPNTIPNEGESCNLKTTTACDYLAPGQVSPGPGFIGGVSAVCRDGVWQWISSACAGGG